MIVIKNKIAIEKMRTAGKFLAEIMKELAFKIEPGVTTLQLDSWIEEEIKKFKMVPRSKGYNGFKHASCISLNEEVVHGIPSAKRFLKTGDLVKVDVVASWKDYCADITRSFCVGDVAPKTKKLAEVARLALDKGIDQVKQGNHLSDVSHAIQKEVEGNGFNVIRDFAGHGIGKRVHEEPEILNYGEPGKGPILREGMTLAIEPMIVTGKYEVYIDEDGWTVKTKDKSWAAHEEDTVLVTDGKPEILTAI